MKKGVMTKIYLLLVLIPIHSVSYAIPAFPGAEGFGANAVGGRGGVVYEVTNLNNAGPGSLREALEARGPRTVVFRVGGTISLTRGIKIVHPYLTIAGQTAPGGGIAIKNQGTKDHSLTVAADHVIIRFLRIRPGNSMSGSTKAIALEAKHSIIDHCSVSWSTDEMIGANENTRNMTIQWCNISKNGIAGSGTLLYGTDFTLHHNLFVHNGKRVPKIGRGDADVVNNVIYNFGDNLGQGSASFQLDDDPTIDCYHANFIGNHYTRGPNSHDAEILSIPNSHANWNECGANYDVAYVEGNITPNRPNDSLPEDRSVQPGSRGRLASSRFTRAPLIRTTTAQVAVDEVLQYAGAVLPERDSVDKSIIHEYNTKTGGLIRQSHNLVWPTLARGTAPSDNDHDGMSDAWENANGLNPNNAADRNEDTDGDGYTNLEEYLNELAASTFPTATNKDRRVPPEFFAVH